MSTAPHSPLRFANSLLINTAFPFPTSNARTLLPNGLEVNLVEVFPGRAVLIVSFALYRESPFGSYAEATISLMASHERTTPVMTLAHLLQQSRYPAYVLHMLVTSAEAQRMGVEVWMLPRVLATVDIVETASQTICSASLDERSVVQMVVDRPVLDRSREGQIETYSQHDGELLRATLPFKASRYGRSQGSGATLLWGDHPIGEHLAGKRISTLPLMVRYYEDTTAELHAPHQCDV